MTGRRISIPLWLTLLCLGGACANEPAVRLGERPVGVGDGGDVSTPDAAVAPGQCPPLPLSEQFCHEPLPICVWGDDDARFDSICEAREAGYCLVKLCDDASSSDQP